MPPLLKPNSAAAWSSAATHLTGVRDELDEEIDVKPQAQALLGPPRSAWTTARSSSDGKVRRR